MSPKTQWLAVHQPRLCRVSDMYEMRSLLTLFIGARISQMKLCSTSVKVSKDSAACSPSTWTLQSEWYVWDEEFIDLFIDVRSSQMKLWSTSVKVSKDSVACSLSRWTFQSKWYVWDEKFIDLFTATTTCTRKSHRDVWGTSRGV